MMASYNMKNPAVKRLMKEAEELRNATEEYHAQPIEDNLFEWHFTVRGPPNTDFDHGIYHGRITLPPDYPMKPPSIIILTPNGRFEINKKICLSISGHHPESWQPSWSIRTALVAIIGFMPTHGNGAIGSLEYTPAERQTLALRSQSWNCPTCGNIKKLLKSKPTTVLNPDSSLENVLNVQKIGIDEPKEMQSVEKDQSVDEFSEETTVPDNLDESQESPIVVLAEKPQDNGLNNKTESTTVPRQRNNALPELANDNFHHGQSLVNSTRSHIDFDYWSLKLMWMLIAILIFLFTRRFINEFL